jgi:O-antigen/teichoic acid export membrane protein
MFGALAKNSIMTLLVLGLQIFVQGGTLILVVRLLPPSLYGYYVALASLAVLLGILTTLGSRFVMLQRAPEGRQAIEDVWRYAWPLTLLMSIILSMLFLFVARFLPSTQHCGWWVVIGIGVIELFIMPFIFLCTSSFHAIDKVAWAQLQQCIPLIFRLLAVIPCFYYDGENMLFIFIVFQCFAATISLVIVMVITRKSFRLFSFPRAMKKSELHQGGSYCIMNFITQNPSEIDKVVLTQFAGAHDAGIYASTSRVLSALMTPIFAILLATQPKLFRCSTGASENTSKLILHIAAWSIVCGLFATLVMILFAPILTYVFGDKYADMSGLAPVLAFVALPFSLRRSSASILIALGHPLQRTSFEIFGTIVLLLSIAIFVPRSGLHGAVTALILAEGLMAVCGWLMVFRAQKSLVQRGLTSDGGRVIP